MEDQDLLQHLIIIPTASTTSTNAPAASPPASPKDNRELKEGIETTVPPSNSAVAFRILSVVIIGLISTWASHEASKGFDLSVFNNAKDSPAGKQFDLFYVSNDKVTRMILEASDFVEDLLYSRKIPADHKKKVNHVILIFGNHNFTNTRVIRDHEYVITISPSLLEGKNVQRDLMTAILQAMTKIWSWGGESSAPPSLVGGMVEYIELLADGGGFDGGGVGNVIIDPVEVKDGEFCWDHGDPKVVARFLYYCDKHIKGFIQRLNLAMKDEWNDQMVDDALGMSAKQLCDYYRKSHDSTTVNVDVL